MTDRLDERGWRILRGMSKVRLDGIHVFRLGLQGHRFHINLVFPFMGPSDSTFYVSADRDGPYARWSPRGYARDRLFDDVEDRGEELSGDEVQKWIESFLSAIKTGEQAHERDPLWGQALAYMQGQPVHEQPDF